MRNDGSPDKTGGADVSQTPQQNGKQPALGTTMITGAGQAGSTCTTAIITPKGSSNDARKENGVLVVNKVDAAAIVDYNHQKEKNGISVCMQHLITSIKSNVSGRIFKALKFLPKGEHQDNLHAHIAIMKTVAQIINMPEGMQNMAIWQKLRRHLFEALRCRRNTVLAAMQVKALGKWLIWLVIISQLCFLLPTH